MERDTNRINAYSFGNEGKRAGDEHKIVLNKEPLFIDEDYKMKQEYFQMLYKQHKEQMKDCIMIYDDRVISQEARVLFEDPRTAGREDTKQETDLILARYLHASGKTEDEFNGYDRFILNLGYLIRGRNLKISGRYEDTKEYEQMQTVLKLMPLLIVVAGALVRLIFRIYRIMN